MESGAGSGEEGEIVRKELFECERRVPSSCRAALVDELRPNVLAQIRGCSDVRFAVGLADDDDKEAEEDEEDEEDDDDDLETWFEMRTNKQTNPSITATKTAAIATATTAATADVDVTFVNVFCFFLMFEMHRPKHTRIATAQTSSVSSFLRFLFRILSLSLSLFVNRTRSITSRG
jgi:hypothetical protein